MEVRRIMGREQKRREAKKNKRQMENNNIDLDSDIKLSTTVKVVMAVVLILLALYCVVAIFVTKELDVSNGNDSSSEKEEVEDQETEEDTGVSNRILAAATFRQSPEVYYVYYYDFDDENEEVASAINKITDNTVYRVDTGDSLNSNYVTEDSANKGVSDIGGLKVKVNTLIKIDNDKVVEYYDGKDEIVNNLNK